MPLKTHLDEAPTLNLTSMIDVVFLLVIFFMLATRFGATESRVDVQVPQVSNAAAPSTQPAKLVVNVLADGRIFLGDEPLTLDELRLRLVSERRQSPRTSVIVRGDATGALQLAAGVLATCREAGISDLGLSVKQASASR